MAGKYKRYPKYKDSGVEWLGEVPESWEVIQIKHLSSVKRGASPRPIDDERYFDSDGEYSWTRIADVSASDMYLIKAPQKLSDLGSSLSVKLEPGSLFLSIAGTVGKPCITGIKACIHDGFVYFPELNIPNKFLFYVFAGEQAYKGLGKFGTQLNLNTDTVGGIKIGCANNQELEKIVSFLDHETAKIDTLIEKQQLLIELLKEKRQAVISHAVTKGLNPNVPMKDSGVEWLGMVPEHWDVKRFKNVVNLASKKVEPGLDKKYVGMENIESGTGRYIIKTEIKPDGISTLFSFENVLFGKLRPYLAKSWLASFSGICSSEFLVLENIGICAKFLNYYTLTDEFIKNVDASTYGSKMPRASWEFISTIFLSVPSYNESRKIANYLDQETAKIDKLISKANDAVTLIKERRTALISAAVTGKIDVRDWRPPTKETNKIEETA